jgi:ABC-type transport system involved in multi-copper enzyme maturation permease subunit
VLTIAALTLREAVRRRIVLVGSSAALVLALASAWGLARLVTVIPNHSAALAVVSALTIFLAFVFSVILAVGAAFLAAPAIASEIESGVALSVLPRPLSRADFVLGKWLGLMVLLAAYAALFGSIEAVGIGIATGYSPPHPLGALLFLIAQGSLMLSFALLLSTRLGAVAGGLVALLGFGVAWIAGITAGIARGLGNATVEHAATLVGLLFPTDGLWRGALFDLEPVALLVASNAAGNAIPNPFGTTVPPTPAFLVWCAAWIAAMLVLAVNSFNQRDI